jgi:3-hydroxyacyl-CoA dehydrogenase
MFWADLLGLKTIADKMKDFETRFGSDFVVSPLLSKLAAEGGTFEGRKG